MKKVKSSERFTGMGAAHYVAVLIMGVWKRVSELEGVHYLGRNSGWEEYEADVPPQTVVAHFDRSNSGKEHVEIEGGLEFRSFDEAMRWGEETAVTAGEKGEMKVCPCCLRPFKDGDLGPNPTRRF